MDDVLYWADFFLTSNFRKCHVITTITTTAVPTVLDSPMADMVDMVDVVDMALMVDPMVDSMAATINATILASAEDSMAVDIGKPIPLDALMNS